MRPIEQFTKIETEYPLCDDDIDYTEYAWEIALFYAPFFINAEDQDGNKFEIETSRAISIFKKRYNQGLIKMPLSYEDYLDDNEVQDTIQGLGMDKDKFWFAVMFTWDYCEGECIKGKSLESSAIGDLCRLKEVISTNDQQNHNPLTEEVSFDKDIEITVHVNNKKTLTISNPNAIKLLALVYDTYHEDNPEIDEDGYVLFKHPILYNRKQHDGPYSTSNSYYITTFYSMMNHLFTKSFPRLWKKVKLEKEFVSYSKQFLISKLIYLTKISDNEELYYDPAAIKGYIKRYKNRRERIYNTIYEEGE